MKDSFGYIYSAFEGFERMMEDAFDGILMRMSLLVSLLPCCLEFFQIVEKESCFQDQKLNDIRCKKMKEVEHC
jgi:hypothetical protein